MQRDLDTGYIEALLLFVSLFLSCHGTPVDTAAPGLRELPGNL